MEQGNCNMSATDSETLQLRARRTGGAHHVWHQGASPMVCRVQSVDALRAALDWARERSLELLVLGGGSNMLLHGDVHALVLHIQMRGVEVLSDDGRRVQVSSEPERSGMPLCSMPWNRAGAAWKLVIDPWQRGRQPHAKHRCVRRGNSGPLCMARCRADFRRGLEAVHQGGVRVWLQGEHFQARGAGQMGPCARGV